MYGPDKSCKTTLSLTFPKPLVHMELDIGGFDRATFANYMGFEDMVKEGLIRHKQYPMPLQANVVPVKDAITLKPSKKLVGYKELYYELLGDYVNNLNNPEIKTVVIDTDTVRWELVCNAYLQEKQENQPANEPLRQQLLQIEYREPNSRMRAFLYEPKKTGTHLVLVHHETDKYKQQLNLDGKLESVRTGEKERAGWNRLGDIADIIVRTYLQKNKDNHWKPWCEVELCGYDINFTGSKLSEPSYDGIVQSLRTLRGG